MSSEAINIITTELPTYLKSLLRDCSIIQFVFCKKNCTEPKQQENGEELGESSDKSELELTGTPLTIDLGNDDTLCGEVTVEKRPPCWTQEEALHFAITLNEARQFLNKHLICEKSHKYMFCICDGKDNLRTVALGCKVFNNQFIRTAVYVLPCCDDKHEMTSIEWMKKQHNVFENKSLQIQIVTIKYYDLFGYSLQNSNSLQNAKYNGNISLEVAQNSNFKMNLSVILGHEGSSLVKFWRELSQVQVYCNLLEKFANKDSTLLNLDACLNYEDITSLISRILTDITYKNRIIKELDLENVREHGVLDKLWKTLQYCRDLGELRDSFTYFFEQLADGERTIPEVNAQNSLVAEIVVGILGGKIAVPSLTCSQSLELLIDLGLQKLKNDYITIIDSFYPVPTQTVDNIWNSNSAFKEQSTRRKTRMTINPRSCLTEQIQFKQKLFSLYSMHKIAEFIFLCKENLALEDNVFDGICQTLINEFLSDCQKVCEFKRTPHLCNFMMNFPVMEELIKELLPSAWCIQLESTRITTVFHFSENPIFPPSVYEDYGDCVMVV